VSSQARRYFERGKQALDTGDLETAQQQLASALQLAPQFGNAICAYAVALAKAGDCPRASAVLRSGIPRATSPISSAAMYATLGDVLILGGDFFGNAVGDTDSFCMPSRHVLPEPNRFPVGVEGPRHRRAPVVPRVHAQDFRSDQAFLVQLKLRQMKL